MYQLVAVDEAMMTRDVWLKNLETGTVDFCFDDSAVMDDKNNFDFMQIGEVYDSKLSFLARLLRKKMGKAQHVRF